MKPILKNRFSISENTLLTAMIYANVFMFAASLILTGSHMRFTMNPLMLLTPSMDVLIFLGASGKQVILEYQNWWSLITANWLHGGLLHILFNMLALKTLVPLAVREFGMFRMFSLYTLTGAAGFLLSCIGNVYLTIGASSGICGLIGALLYFGKSSGGPWGQLVYKQTIGWVISLVVIGFLIPNINNYSHAGGLVSGIVLGWLFKYNGLRRESLFDRVLAFSLGGITVWLLLSHVIQGIVLVFF